MSDRAPFANIVQAGNQSQTLHELQRITEFRRQRGGRQAAIPRNAQSDSATGRNPGSGTRAQYRLPRSAVPLRNVTKPQAFRAAPTEGRREAA